jgi:hypothetical protein
LEVGVNYVVIAVYIHWGVVVYYPIGCVFIKLPLIIGRVDWQLVLVILLILIGHRVG